MKLVAGEAAWSPGTGLIEPAGGVLALVDDYGIAIEMGARADLRRRHASLPLEEGFGLLLPGLVDAHAHLELGALAGRVPGGDGLGAWVSRLLAVRSGLSPAELVEGARAAARSMRAAGTTAVGDVCTVLATAPLMLEAGLMGPSLLEVVGATEAAAIEAMAEARRRQQESGGHLVPHSVYGTALAAIRALAEEGTFQGALGIASIHAAEHADEDAWLLRGEGPFAPFLRSKGAIPPRRSAVSALMGPGIVGRGSLLVHLVTASPAELASLRERGAIAVLCPRSNVHIGARLPDLRAIRQAGLRLALGTDSLASTPDHDLLGEVATLLEAFPDASASALLEAATDGLVLGLGPQRLVRSHSSYLPAILPRLRTPARALA